MRELELLNWTEFKSTCITTKKLRCQYTETDEGYNLYGPDTQGLLWHTAFLKTSPRSSDQIDFEDNYKSTFNAASATTTPIHKQSEFSVTTRVETTVSACSYTVTSGKSFYLALFVGSYDGNQGIAYRLKVNGSLLFKLHLNGGPNQGYSNSYPLPVSVKIANGGDIITVTSEAGIGKGSAWVSYVGVEL